jgi:hypothetical protein
MVLTFALVVAAGSAALTVAALEAPHLAAGTEASGSRCIAPPNFSRAPHRPFTVSDAEIYRDSCALARLFGPKRMAREYRVRSTNRLTICQRFAKVGYRPVLFRHAIKGCLKGFRLWDSK